MKPTANGAAPITAREVSKWYGPVIALNQVTLEIEPGIIGLLGPNGSGKSTLMKLITGQLRPSLGEVQVFGRPVWRRPAARRSIGYAPEADCFHEEMSGRRFVASMARLSGLAGRRARRRTEEVLAAVGMEAAAGKPLRDCSRGMRQRIKIAQALVHDPELLVLDEPLSGIDPAGRLELLDLFRSLRGGGKTLIISSHILEEVEAISDRIVLMNRGRVLASGTVARIRGLLEDHPLTIRIACDRRRDLAAALIARETVVGVSLPGRPAAVREDGGLEDLVVKVRTPEAFFRELPRLLADLRLEVEALEPLDESAEAVFAYLVGGGTAAAGAATGMAPEGAAR